MMQRIFILALLLLGVSSFSIGQVESHNYILTHYDENSLPQSSVEDLMFDQHGFLWMTTQMGILRFDGNSILEYNQITTNDFTSNRFRDIIDSHYFKGDDDSYYAIDKNNYVPRRLTNSHAVFMNKVFENKREMKNYLSEIEANYGENAHSILETFSRTFFFPTEKSKGYLISYRNLFAVGRDKKLLLDANVTFPTNVSILDNFLLYRNGDKTESFNENGRVNLTSLFYGEVRTKDINVKQTLFFSTKSGYYFLLVGDQLFQVSRKGKKYFTKLVFNKVNIPDLTYMDYSPKYGVYAFGSFSKGLYLLRNNPFFTIKPFENDNHSVVYSSIILNRCNILLNNGMVYDQCLKKMRNQLKLDENVFSYLRDKQKRIWFHQKLFLYCYDEQFDLIHKWNLKPIDAVGIIPRKIVEDDQGVIWFNTYSKLHRIEGSILKPNQLPYIKLQKGEYIETFYFLNSNRLLLGTSKQLLEINLEKKTAKRILKNMDVRAIYEDRDGDIWIGTYGDGFYYLKEGVLKKVPIDKNKHLVTAHTFLLDADRVLWISTNKGLFAISKSNIQKGIQKRKQTLEYMVFTTKEGLLGNEFNGGCFPVSYAYNKRFYFPSMNGLVSFNPKELTYNNPVFPIVLNSLQCDGKQLNSNSITLAPDFHRLSMSFSTPYWGNSKSLSVSYRLHGSVDSGWHNLVRGENIHVSNLPYGDYTLIVRVKNVVGDSSAHYKKIQIRVLPYFYQHTLARISFVFMLLTLITLAYWLRLKFLLRERKALRKQVSKQVQELFEANTNLELAFSQLSDTNEKLEHSNDVRAKLVSIFVHDLKSPLRFLALVTKKMFQGENKMTEEEVKSMSGDLYHYSMTAMQYIDHFLVWQSVNQNHWKIKREEIRVYELFEEIADSYESICRKNGNVILLSCAENLTVSADMELLRIVLRNLVDNANKYTHEGTIQLVGSEKENGIALQVIDSGKGLTAEEIQLIHSYMQQRNFGKVHTHIGYQIVGDFLQKMNAKICIHSDGEEKGAVVDLLFPK